MHELSGSPPRRRLPSRWITRSMTVAVLAFAALMGLGAVPAGAPVWRLDGPGGGLFFDPVFAPSDASRVYVSSYLASFRSDDGGASFERLPTPTVPNSTFLGTLSVDPTDRDHLLAVVCGNHCRRLVRSLDGGLTWDDVLRLDIDLSVAGFAAGTPFVLTEQGMLRSDDGGVTWSPSGPEGLPIGWMSFDRRRPSLAIAVSYSPLTLWRSEDVGRSWERMRTPLRWSDVNSLRFDPVRPGTLYALADRHAVRSTDDGKTWQRMLDSEFFALQVLGDGTVLLSQGFGLLRSTDGGLTFSPAPAPGPRNPEAARPDDGIEWIAASPNPHQALASGGLGLWSTHDSGRSWQPASGLAAHDVKTLRASAGGEPRVYAVAGSAIFAREGVPGGWRKVHRGSRLAGAAPDISPWGLLGFEVDPSDSLHLVAFDSHELLDSGNGGRSWRSFPPAGLQPLGPFDVTGMAMDWSTGAIYAAVLESANLPRDPPALPYPRLAVTRDGGATWERLRPFARRNPRELFLSLAVDPRDTSVLWGKTTQAGLFRSGDRGHTWNLIGRGLPQNPERFREMRTVLAFDPGDPQRMIAAVPGRGVWQSADGGRTFRRLGQGLDTAVVTTLASATDPATGRRHWLAGAEGVFRLDGDRWTAVATFAEPVQLSGAFAFDPLDPAVLYAGTYGRSVLRLSLRER